VCGICGIVDFHRPPEHPDVERMSARLAHRGPDGEAAFCDGPAALGFRRLAIIDLTEAAMQPVVSADGRLRLLHNGEIYNYRELRAELEACGHTFRSAGDAEVALAAYVEWGEACLERFNGMWAIAVWDRDRRRLFCARDRFGVKPFYYRLEHRRFAFASEPAALPGPFSANPRAVREYLAQGYLDHEDETFFAGVRRLPPGHALTFDEDGPRLRCWWRLSAGEVHDDAADELRELFLDSVRLRLRSDVPVGTALSGGLDSSAVAVAVDGLLRNESGNAASVGAAQRTFTAYFEEAGFDERPFARAVVDRAKVEPTWISFDANDLVDNLPVIIRAQGEPFGSTSIAAGWYVMRAAARAGVKVMLDGQGGDEVLGGYRALVGCHLADLVARGRALQLGRELPGLRSTFGVLPLAVATARPFAPERVVREVRGRVRRGAPLVHADLPATGPATNGSSAFGSRFRRHQDLLITRRGLPELLRYEDRNSMAHGVEARLPFLDYRLVELALAVPAERLLRGGRTKALLRDALADLLPPQVRNRTDKVGFATPEPSWFRGRLGELAADVFASQAFRQRGFVDARAANRLLARHRAGTVTAGMELWRALNLELWARELLDP
jgi:asparagine synthase (glutamine-hydrolysing)